MANSIRPLASAFASAIGAASTPKPRPETRLPTEWLAIYARHIDNVRAALNWAVSPDGDPTIGVALTIVAVPLWVQLSLMGECRNWVERALAAGE